MLDHSKISTFTCQTNLLQASPEETSQLRSIHKNQYSLYHVDNLGSFLLDDSPDLIKNTLKNNLEWEPLVLQLIKKFVKPNSSAIDAGAHIGTHTLSISKSIGYNGIVYAFEPQVKIFAELIMNLQQNQCNNVVAYRAALGDLSGTIRMEKPQSGNEGTTKIGIGGDYAPMVTIDELGLSDLSLLKIDVEYFENKLLQGALKTIEKSRPVILIEILKVHSTDSLTTTAKRVLKTLSLLKKMRYVLMHIKKNDYLALPLERAHECNLPIISKDNVTLLSIRDHSNLSFFSSRTNHFQAAPEEITFFKNFSQDKYTLHHVDNLGYFFLDENPDLIKDTLKENRIWEPLITQLIKKHVKPQSSVIDAGAHIGIHTLTLSKAAGSKGSVYAFEPQMKLFTELVMNLRKNCCNNVIAYRAALGDRQDTIQMQNCLAQNEGATGIGTGGDYAPMITIDELGLSDLSLLKIDVKYFENQVLQGAFKTIEKSRPVILIEILNLHETDSSDRTDKRVLETLTLLQKMNYVLMNIKKEDYIALPVEKAEECSLPTISARFLTSHARKEELE
jgi:FkbM family methyltransferase